MAKIFSIDNYINGVNENDKLQHLIEAVKDLSLQDIDKIAALWRELNKPVFFSIRDVANMTGWSLPTVQALFNRADFPCCSFGRAKLVEASALKEYFSTRRVENDKNYIDIA